MVKINILTENSSRNEFLHELDTNKFPPEKFYIKENSREDTNWDLVIVYEGLDSVYNLCVKENCVIFYSGEPPMSRVYPSNFLKQFDTLVTQRPNIKHKDNRLYQPSMNWHLFFSFNQNKYTEDYAHVRDMSVPQKSKCISMITSAKRIMPGHGQRMNFVKALQDRYGDKIDFYGQGIKFVDMKYEAMQDYMFTIAIENSCISDYWTEKFADPILAYTVPIYCGCTNINKYFTPQTYIPIDINDPKSAFAAIDRILTDPKAAYNEHITALKAARGKIMEEYNLFSEVWRMFGNQAKSEAEYVDIALKPSFCFASYKPLFFSLKIRRFLWRLWLTVKRNF